MSKRALILLSLLVPFAACDFVTKAQGVMELAKEVGEHLEKDLEAPLTNAKIDKVLEVTPELIEFSKTAKEKWKPDPQGQDIQNLAASLGALSEYLAFFKARDTRITTYYVDLIKVVDARWQIVYTEANAKAREQLTARKAEIEADASLDGPAKEKALKQVEIAIQQLEQAKLKKPEAQPDQPQGGKNSAYTLSDEEIALVAARLDEITTALKAADYIKDGPAESAEPVETPDPSQPGK